MIETRKFIAFNQPDISELEIEAVSDVMRSGWLGNGVKAQEFEGLFSRNGEHSVAVNSCTMGLYLALKAEGITQWDQVITTPLTFGATANAILAAGASPRFLDVDENGLIDVTKIEKVIQYNTKAIIPVHLHGAQCDMDSIMEIARKHNLVVIEDAAHFFGGPEIKGDYGVYSFYPTKNITTGDGGMVVTKSRTKAQQIRTMAAQGLSADAWLRYGSGPVKEYSVISQGFKGSMNDISAAIGITQFKRWDEIKEKRESVWNIYESAFGKKQSNHSHHIYSIQVPQRNEFRSKLQERGIGTGVHYKPLHLEPAYKQLCYEKNDFQIAEKIGSETLSLPLSSKMSVEDANFVVDAVEEIKGELNG